jgi:hypothetical protein
MVDELWDLKYCVAEILEMMILSLPGRLPKSEEYAMILTEALAQHHAQTVQTRLQLHAVVSRLYLVGLN